VVSRRPARIAYSSAVAFALALVVTLAAFGALESPLSSGGGSDGPFIASIGTFQDGQWICHWNGGGYRAGSAGTASNWTPVLLSSPAVHAAHTRHTFDFGPEAGFTTSAACARSAAANSPSVTINQAAGQADPTNASSITFTVVFSQSVTDFSAGDVSLSGTAGATTATVSGGPRTYEVAVRDMTGSGTAIATVPGGVAHNNLAGHANVESKSTDNTVTNDVTARRSS
jgi:hypothetical protein